MSHCEAQGASADSSCPLAPPPPPRSTVLLRCHGMRRRHRLQHLWRLVRDRQVGHRHLCLGRPPPRSPDAERVRCPPCPLLRDLLCCLPPFFSARVDRERMLTTRTIPSRLCAIMAQILSIYGLVISVIIANQIYEKMPIYTGFLQLGAGLSVGLCGLAAGFAIGIVGDSGVRASTQQPRLYVGMVLILIFAEVLGLYGGVVAVMMYSRATLGATVCKY
ncbi:hypothetical protein JDV02_007476 [Purpureocillium takamizusanense]|uniref:V-type proton ATPase proteolipid subunit n=1 Tax=Purpureocillium takamizusanense TaxID=2060973 RepID=A0A9Q8QIB8_9HYPO|nr:uncharacterized protein JDV02_007476 [Purpureocillium takamizusanense]UNI21489.1 hypothetical protein JDV02_007476 [Purpureocillium takamizusanense]